MNGDQGNMGPHKFWRRKKFWAIVVILIILAIIFCHHDGYEGYGENSSNLHTVAVSGHGEVSGAPDIATFNFSAMGQGATVAIAQDKMTKIVNAAIDFVKKDGVDAKDIQTSNYSVNPTYEYRQQACPANTPCPPYGSQVITGYEVSETVTVKLRDLSKSGDVLSGIGSIGVSQVSGLTLTIDNPDALKEEARKMAIDKAKAEASQLSKDLGVHLKRIVSFTESENMPTPVAYQRALGVAADKAVAVPVIEPGQNKVTSDVTITYEIK